MDQSHLLMHQVMIGDRVRMDAYDNALRRVVNPDSVVVDVGAGTLMLTLMALRHGARHAYAIEADPQMIPVAESIIRANGLADRVTLIVGDARAVRLPEKADIVVAEMMGNLGPEEEMPEIIEAVCERNLTAGGRIVPQRIATHLQAIQFDDEGWGVWKDQFWDFSLSCVQEFIPSQAQVHFFSRNPILLSEPCTLADTALGETAEGLGGAQTLSITSPGTLHAVIGYFTATLDDDVRLSNFPSYPGSNWAVWAWPVRHTPVIPGQQLRVSLNRPEQAREVTNWTLDCSIARRRSA